MGAEKGKFWLSAANPVRQLNSNCARQQVVQSNKFILNLQWKALRGEMNKPHDELVQVSVSRLVMIVMIVGDSRGIDLMKIWQGAALNLPLNSFQTLAAFSQYPHQ